MMIVQNETPFVQSKSIEGAINQLVWPLKELASLSDLAVVL